jgi:hypothetical protein
MKKPFRSLILFFLLVACGKPTVPATKTPAESGFERTKLHQITAEAETQTAGYPANDATITAILANKYALGTAMAATLTAQPTGTSLPTFPPTHGSAGLRI